MKPTIPQIERVMDQLRKILLGICAITSGVSSQGTESLEIGVTRTLEHTTVATGEDGILDSGIVCKVSSANNDLSLPRPNFQYIEEKGRRATAKLITVRKSYTLVRLFDLGEWESEVLDDLDRERVKDVASIAKLDDGSIEMVVLLTYLPTLQDELGKKFPGSKVDPNYAPYDTTTEILSFIQRAQRMIRTAWPTAAAYYSYLRILAHATVLQSITHWECHECGAGNRTIPWKESKRRKVCKNSECGRKRCLHCFFLNKDSERVLYCDGTEYEANTNDDPEYVPPVRE